MCPVRPCPRLDRTSQVFPNRSAYSLLLLDTTPPTRPSAFSRFVRQKSPTSVLCELMLPRSLLPNFAVGLGYIKKMGPNTTGSPSECSYESGMKNFTIFVPQPKKPSPLTLLCQFGIRLHDTFPRRSRVLCAKFCTAVPSLPKGPYLGTFIGVFGLIRSLSNHTKSIIQLLYPKNRRLECRTITYIGLATYIDTVLAIHYVESFCERGCRRSGT